MGDRSDQEVSSSCAHRRRSLQLSTTGYALVLLTAAAAILRFVYLDSKSFWQDEGATAYRVTETFSDLIRPHPGEDYMMLYYALLRWWIRVAGSSEISLRLPSVIAATAAVPLTYALGAELVDRRVGLLAALLMAINVSCIQYAQEARSYAMVGMLVALSSPLFVRCIKRPSLARSAIYVMAGPWAAYAHLFAILILPAQWLSLFLLRVDRETRYARERGEEIEDTLLRVGVSSQVRVWIITDPAHKEHPTVQAIEAGRQVAAAPYFVGVNLALVERLRS